MKSKNEQQKKHFTTHYAGGQKFLSKRKGCVLTCIHSKICKFNKEKEASYSGALGDPGSDVMLVAESPSTGLGQNAYLAGTTKYYGSKKDEKKALPELRWFLDHIKKATGFYPYFTDLVKCGSDKTYNKAPIGQRRKKCTKLHLENEIRILKPKKIFCFGRDSHQTVQRLVNKNFKEFGIEVKQLTHFSKRAPMYLSPNDKTSLIWPLELGLVTSRKQALDLISNFKYFKDKLPLK